MSRSEEKRILSKPFHLEEFLMRVERLLIRAERNGGGLP